MKSLKSVLSVSNTTVLLIIIFALGLFLRTGLIWNKPLVIEEDEARQTAFSLIILGKLNLPFGDGVIARVTPLLGFPLFFYEHPPFTMYSCALFVSALGLNSLSMRLTSILLGSFSILLVYKFAGKMFGNRVGLTAAFILAVSALDIQESRVARVDETLSFFILATVTSFYFFTLKRNKFYLLASALLCSFGILTKYTGFISLAIIILSAILVILLRKMKPHIDIGFIKLKEIAWFTICALILPCVYWLASWQAFNLRLEEWSLSGQHIEATMVLGNGDFPFLGQRLAHFISLSFSYGMVPLILLAIIGLGISFRKKLNIGFLLLFLWLVLFGLPTFAFSSLEPRYFALLIAPTAVFASICIWYPFHSQANNRVIAHGLSTYDKKRVISTLIIILTLSTVVISSVWSTPFAKEYNVNPFNPFQEVGNYIKAHSSPNDTIYYAGPEKTQVQLFSERLVIASLANESGKQIANLTERQILDEIKSRHIVFIIKDQMDSREVSHTISLNFCLQHFPIEETVDAARGVSVLSNPRTIILVFGTSTI